MDEEMNGQEFANYMTSFERRLDGRFGRLDRRLGAIDGTLEGIHGRLETIDLRLNAMDRRLDAMDARFDAMDARFDAIDRRFDAMDARFDAIDRRFDGVDRRLEEHENHFDRLSGAFDDLKQQMTVQFEATRRDCELSLEAVNILGERMDRRFDDLGREHFAKTAPLEDAVRHVAQRRRKTGAAKPRRRGP